MNKNKIALRGFWNNYIIFTLGTMVSYLLTMTAVWVGLWGVGLAVFTLLILMTYYVVTFFKDEPSGSKLYFYFFTLLILIAYFGLIYKSFGIKTPEGEELSYLNAIYFSVVTWTTLGYGDFLPISGEVKVFVMLEALVGQIYMGILVGKVIVLAQFSKQPNGGLPEG